MPPRQTPTPEIPPQVAPISTLAPASTFDRQYIDMLVPHHQASVEMARVALERSQRAEIRQIAEAIVATGSEDIDELRILRQTWFGSGQTPPMSQMPVLLEPGAPVATGTHLTLDLEAIVEQLRAVPEPFDVAFVETMIPHHQRAIDASLLAIRRVKQQELLDTAGAVVASHTRVIHQLNELR
jgi:uncharacterized protein (DUF305 family)